VLHLLLPCLGIRTHCRQCSNMTTRRNLVFLKEGLSKPELRCSSLQTAPPRALQAPSTARGRAPAYCMLNMLGYPCGYYGG